MRLKFQATFCFVRGACLDSSLVSVSASPTAAQCSTFCRNDQECEFFTYSPDDGYCAKVR